LRTIVEATCRANGAAWRDVPSQLDKRLVATEGATQRTTLVHETARADVERDDFNIGFRNRSSERLARKGRGARHKRDCRTLFLLTDGDFGDAFQAPAQRHFHGRCARGSGDAAHLRHDRPKAIVGV
jgi:hypothetical protein